MLLERALNPEPVLLAPESTQHSPSANPRPMSTDKLKPLITNDDIHPHDCKPEFTSFEASSLIECFGCFGPCSRQAVKSFLEAQNIKVQAEPQCTRRHCCCCCRRGIRSLDPETIRQMQTFLNEANPESQRIPVDGWWGRRSGKALQQFLNARWETAGFRSRPLCVDGRTRCRTVRAFQTFLNAHTKRVAPEPVTLVGVPAVMAA